MVLVSPGNSVEFTGDGRSAGVGIFFISGEISSPGRKDLIPGMTLYQALAASGGAKGNPKRAIIRRKNESGVYVVYSHDLRSIRDGKAVDPSLVFGDVIEIGN
jgi:protein involved in polysaccharide export with SLBB domain